MEVPVVFAPVPTPRWDDWQGWGQTNPHPTSSEKSAIYKGQCWTCNDRSKSLVVCMISSSARRDKIACERGAIEHGLWLLHITCVPSNRARWCGMFLVLYPFHFNGNLVLCPFTCELIFVSTVSSGLYLASKPFLRIIFYHDFLYYLAYLIV